jgi:hypothetical protein
VQAEAVSSKADGAPVSEHRLLPGPREDPNNESSGSRGCVPLAEVKCLSTGLLPYGHQNAGRALCLLCRPSTT